MCIGSPDLLQKRRGRLCISEQSVNVRDMAQANHGIAPEFTVISDGECSAGIAHHYLGNAYFVVVKIQQIAIHVNATDTGNSKIHTELTNKIPGSFANDAAIAVAHFTTGNDNGKILPGKQYGRHVQVIGHHFQIPMVQQRSGHRFG